MNIFILKENDVLSCIIFQEIFGMFVSYYEKISKIEEHCFSFLFFFQNFMRFLSDLYHVYFYIL